MCPKISGKNKTSALWQFFQAIDAEYAVCNICKQKLSYKTSTSNLKKHMINKHSTVNLSSEEKSPLHEKISEPQPSTSRIYSRSTFSETQSSNSEQNFRTNTSDFELQLPQLSTSTPKQSTKLYQQSNKASLSRKTSPKSKNKIDQKLLNLFIKDLQPFSIVEDSGFKEFVSALNPAYELPNRYVIAKTLLPTLYKQCVTNTKNLVATGKTFCLTTDSWTSFNTTSYVATTAHFLDDNFTLHSVLLECSASGLPHTSANLALELQRIVTEWGIENKVILAVADNAANIQKAIQELGWNKLGYIAHTINLIIRDGLMQEEIQTIIDKVRSIVKDFRRSNNANDKLLKFQENLGKTPLKLILEVATRWNSTFYMLRRFLELEEAIKSTLSIIDKDLPSLTTTEWKIIKELFNILQPFEDASKTLSGEYYCTAALVIPLYNGLSNVFDKFLKKEFSQPVKDVVQLLNKSLHERLRNTVSNSMLSISTFLDPKFKNIGLADESKAAQTKQIILSLIAENIAESAQECQADIEISINDPHLKEDSEEMSIWLDFDKSVSASQSKETFSSRAIIEMQRYMEEDIISRSSDSLNWWRKHRQMLPYLSEIAKERLCTLALSVPCERLFSKAGQILTDRRNKLSDKKVQMLLFMNANHKYLTVV